MRTARRSLVIALVLVTSVVATPAYAGDDSPGLLDTLGKTVDSLTAPILPKPKAEPAPAPVSQPASTPTVVESVGSTVTKVTTTVVDTVRSTPLAPVLEPVLGLVAPKATTPGVVVPEVVTPKVVAPERDLTELISTLDLLGAAGQSSPRAADTHLLASGSFATESDDEAVETIAQTSHIPGTSTLPDGGSPLTATWLVLWAGIAAAGALIVRRSRTS